MSHNHNLISCCVVVLLIQRDMLSGHRAKICIFVWCVLCECLHVNDVLWRLLSVSWSYSSSPAAAGRWWWSSSQRRWCWGSEGSAAAGLTETRQSPGRPPSVHVMRSSLPPLLSPWEENRRKERWMTGTEGFELTAHRKKLRTKS